MCPRVLALHIIIIWDILCHRGFWGCCFIIIVVVVLLFVCCCFLFVFVFVVVVLFNCLLFTCLLLLFYNFYGTKNTRVILVRVFQKHNIQIKNTNSCAYTIVNRINCIYFHNRDTHLCAKTFTKS